ncbi:MAG: KH domain-containing protein [Candidatus Diapherotrites archaeon]
MLTELVKVPAERIAVLIGKKGETKRELEQKTKARIDVDSESGEVEVSGKNAEGVVKAESVVKAIARGFSPEKAFMLLKEDFFLEIIDLAEELGKKGKRLESKKGRVIGRHGLFREEIEKKTKAFVSVYGKTICLIGTEGEIGKALRAVEMLLEGAKHKSVKKFLDKKEKREIFEI